MRCGRCRRVTRTIRCAGTRSRAASPQGFRRRLGPRHRRPARRAMNRRYGSAGFGSILFATMSMSGDTRHTSIGARSSTGWCGTRPIGPIQASIDREHDPARAGGVGPRFPASHASAGHGCVDWFHDLTRGRVVLAMGPTCGIRYHPPLQSFMRRLGPWPTPSFQPAFRTSPPRPNE